MTDRDAARMARMYRGDCAWALAALVALWATIAFVFLGICQQCGDRNVIAALGIGGSVLLLLNTASIIALVRHYTADRLHLYGLDLFYIDEMRRAKREAADAR